jgi:hypothetical protein
MVAFYMRSQGASVEYGPCKLYGKFKVMLPVTKYFPYFVDSKLPSHVSVRHDSKDFENVLFMVIQQGSRVYY